MKLWLKTRSHPNGKFAIAMVLCHLALQGFLRAPCPLVRLDDMVPSYFVERRKGEYQYQRFKDIESILLSTFSAMSLQVDFYGKQICLSLNPDIYAGSPAARVCKNVAPAFYLGFMDLYRKVHPTAAINEEVETYYETQSFVSRNSQEGD